LLKTVASLKDNDETDTITAPLFRIGRCGDARLVNWKEVVVFESSFLPSATYTLFMLSCITFNETISPTGLGHFS
jgi:hypothetical protein